MITSLSDSMRKLGSHSSCMLGSAVRRLEMRREQPAGVRLQQFEEERVAHDRHLDDLADAACELTPRDRFEERQVVDSAERRIEGADDVFPRAVIDALLDSNA